MLDQFYNYLSGEIIYFFSVNHLTPGSKYNIQFEKQEEVMLLYETLKSISSYEIFEYMNNKNEVKYTSYSLEFNGVKLIVSATIGNIQPDFLTRLRNMVGVEDGYEDKAILFIHDTNLDSIMGGTESFSKEGMPFHVTSIQKDIYRKLTDSSLSSEDKAIIEFNLQKKKNELMGESSTIFDYKDLLETINGNCIEKYQYKNFGLFYDSDLHNYNDKDLKKRIEDNSKYFNIVEGIHNYGNPEVQLEKYFDDKGIIKLKVENWKEVDYKDVDKSVEEKKKVKPIEYLYSNQDWDREEGTSKVKSRIRNICVFNENNNDYVELEFVFDGYIKNEFLKKEGNVELSSSGKRIKAIISNSNEDVDFYKVVYKEDNIKFEFKIVMLKCNEKYLESIKTKYLIVLKNKNNYISINTNDTSITFNEFIENPLRFHIHEVEFNDDIIELSEDEKLEIKIKDTFEFENDSDIVKFSLKVGQCLVPFGLVGTSERISPIEGLKVWKLKRENKCDFKLSGDNKLLHGTKEYFTRDEFRKTLQLEKQIIESEGISFIEFDDGLESIELELNNDVKSSYIEIIRYFKLSNKLPSLAFLNDELINLYKNFIKIYISELEQIKEEMVLKKEQKNLFRIGSIKREIEDREILFSSLHPLNIAYQINLYNFIDDEGIDDDILKKFTSTYLLPYIVNENGDLYITIEQHHSPEWTFYVDESLPRYKGSRDFVSKLVNEKIEEFVAHFRYMFDMSNNAPIRINLINTGDSKEILQGIFKYYIKKLKTSSTDILPIDLFLYSNKNVTNAFEEVAFNHDVDDLKRTYGLDLIVEGMSEEDVLDLFRNKVKFYSKNIENVIEYAHITFLEMFNDIKPINSIMDHITSGALLNGSISGLPSVYIEDSYRTGFGIKYANIGSELMKVAISLNALNAASGGEPFSIKQCKAISIPNKNKSQLDSIYDNSHWVTFIDPKVNLNFFKNDPDAKDLLIIHYSDQYTTAGGYDAITVTRKSVPYKRVIEEFLISKNVENARKYSPKIINMFNAFNGDWLLRLLSSKSNFPKEKLSILSAIKLAMAELKNNDITWIPISLEEVLRVSGGAGLKQTEGFFSVKNLGFENNGATSDDILLIGVEAIKSDVVVYFYPVEVKIGINEHSYISKGIEQAKSTKKLLKETLLPKENETITTTQRVYRNFLMQLAINSAEKLKIYNFDEDLNYNVIIDTDLRRKLLNEEYKISDALDESIGEAAVISFKKYGKNDEDKVYTEDGVTVIEMSEDNGIQFITKGINEIYEIVGGIKIEKKVKKSDIIDINTLAKSDFINSSNGEEAEITNNTGKLNEVDKVSEQKSSSYEGKGQGIKIKFGVNEKNNTDVLWWPNNTDKLMHTNTGIIGTMGTGKTQFTKSMITQIHKQSKFNLDSNNIGILIFDYKGDYNKSKKDFIDATDASVYELFHLPFNPLSIFKSDNSKPMLPLHTANGLKETIAKSFGLGIKQETLLRDMIMDAYDKKGIIKNDPETWNNSAPTLKDVYDVYISKEDLKEDSLYAAFSNLIDFEIFEPNHLETKSLFEIIKGVTVIDLSGYDPGIQNLVVAITLDLFYSQMQVHGHSKIEGSLRQLNKIILVDEADNFLSKNFSSLKRILKEGREFGVGTILSTQLLSHFSTAENDYANYILTWVIHNVADLSTKDVKYIFNTKSKNDEENLFYKIKSLNKHHSLVKMGGNDRPIYMKDMAFWELIK